MQNEASTLSHKHYYRFIDSTDNQHPPVQATMILAIIEKEQNAHIELEETIYIIAHHKGKVLDNSMGAVIVLARPIPDDQPCLKVTAKDLHRLDEKSYISTTCKTFLSFSFKDRLRIAIVTRNEAYIGKLALTGELALVSRQAYQVMEEEYDTVLQLVHALNDSIKPIFSEEGRRVIESFFDEEGNFNKTKALGDLGKHLYGGSKIIKTIQKFNSEPFRQLSPDFLLEISKRHNLDFDHIEALVKKFTPEPTKIQEDER